jgi:hypothetical protein
MQKSAYITVIVLFVLASVSYSAYHYIKNEKESTIDTQGYLETKATVTAVYPVRITRYGAKQSRCDIRFIDKKEQQRQKFRCELGSGYKVGDTLDILYDLDNPDADVVVKNK